MFLGSWLKDQYGGGGEPWGQGSGFPSLYWETPEAVFDIKFLRSSLDKLSQEVCKVIWARSSSS